jgi:hypothetical protein
MRGLKSGETKGEQNGANDKRPVSGRYDLPPGANVIVHRRAKDMGRLSKQDDHRSLPRP